MERAELKVTREALGLSAGQLAAAVGVGVRAVQRWEFGGSLMSADHDAAVRALVDATEAEVAARVGAAGAAESPRLVTYGTQQAYVADHPHAPAWRTARWDRAVAARVAAQCPRSVIVFAEDS